MHAIVSQGGHQYRVTQGTRLLVDRLPDEVGSHLELKPALFISDEAGSESKVAPSSATVTVTVVAHRLGSKLRVFKYKPKKRYRRTMGHRSKLTELRVDSVVAGGHRSAHEAGTVSTADRKAAVPVEAVARPASEPVSSSRTHPEES